jgi:hypothetical protein
MEAENRKIQEYAAEQARRDAVLKANKQAKEESVNALQAKLFDQIESEAKYREEMEKVFEICCYFCNNMTLAETCCVCVDLDSRRAVSGGAGAGSSSQGARGVREKDPAATRAAAGAQRTGAVQGDARGGRETRGGEHQAADAAEVRPGRQDRADECAEASYEAAGAQAAGGGAAGGPQTPAESGEAARAQRENRKRQVGELQEADYRGGEGEVAEGACGQVVGFPAEGSDQGLEGPGDDGQRVQAGISEEAGGLFRRRGSVDERWVLGKFLGDDTESIQGVKGNKYIFYDLFFLLIFLCIFCLNKFFFLYLLFEQNKLFELNFKEFL